MARLPQEVQQQTDEAKVFTFEPLPAGTYIVNCIEASYSEVSSKGDPMAKWVFKVSPNQEDGQGGYFREAMLFYYATFAPDQAPNLKAPFVAMELTTDSEDAEFVGQSCLAVVGIKRDDRDTSIPVDQRPRSNNIRALKVLDGALAASSGIKASGTEDPNAWE